MVSHSISLEQIKGLLSRVIAANCGGEVSYVMSMSSPCEDVGQATIYVGQTITL